MAEAKFVPLLASAFDQLRDRPARAFFGLLIGLWTVLLVGLVLLPVGGLAYFVLGRSLNLVLPLCALTTFVTMVYLIGRIFYTYQLLMATNASFFEAWAESGPQRSRGFIVAALTFLLLIAGAILLVVPGVIVFVGLCLAPAVLVLEKQGGLDSLRASWDMMQGWKWRVFLWALAYFGVSFTIQMALNIVPLLGPIISFCLNIFVFNPMWVLFLLEFYRSLKAKAQEPEPFNARSLILVPLAVVALLAAGGYFAFQERGKLMGMLMKKGFDQTAGQDFAKAFQAAEGEPAVPPAIDPVFAPAAAQPPFTAAWAGVGPGVLAVTVAGTVAVAGENGSVATFSYAMAPLLSRSSETQVMGIAGDSVGGLGVFSSAHGQMDTSLARLGPDLAPAFTWTVSGVGVSRKGNPIAMAGANLWMATAGGQKALKLYDPQGLVQRQGKWTQKDPGVVYALSLAADQVGGLYLLADSYDMFAKPPAVARRLYYFDNVPNDPAAEAHCAWDLTLPAQLNEGYGLVAVTWEGVPYVADRHGLSAVPAGAVAHTWSFDLGVPLRGFAIDPWGVAHFLDAKGRMQRMGTVAY